MPPFQGGNDTVTADTFGDLISERQQITGDERRRARLLERKLRMPVEIMPDGDALFDEGKDSPFGVVLRTRAVNADIHGSVSCAGPLRAAS
ncbi:hypothetical protein D3C71_779930 [compost metagenome]